jgi:hypothetical protein
LRSSGALTRQLRTVTEGRDSGSSVALGRTVQDRDPRKFRRSNNRSIGGHEFDKFRCTNEAVPKPVSKQFR